MICKGLDEGEQFWCAGNLYTMLIPRDETQCLEAALETIEPGHATPPNAHATFVQIYFVVAGNARVHIGGEATEIAGPAIAFVPKNTVHHVENIGQEPLRYVYVSVWPGTIPAEEGLSWREACDAMVEMYESRGHSARGRA